MESAFQDIVAKAMMDEDFLNEFLSDPVRATADHNLSEEEVAVLNSVDRVELARIGDELGERISKGYIDLGMLELDGDPEHNSSHTNTHVSSHTKG